MTTEAIRQLLEAVRAGALDVATATEQLKTLPFADLGYANVDYHRQLRTGFPEVIFCPGKTPEQVAGIAAKIAEAGQNLLATRATPELFAFLRPRFLGLEYHEEARILYLSNGSPAAPGARVLVVSGGTADHPVAEEAAITAEKLGQYVERLYDVGVAGLHRLLSRRDRLDAADVVIAVAGMEGALASVVGGLVDKPVIAVPTSIGYGASFGGLAALLAMLNSCASGVAVVNIDNGFGAGHMAATIGHRIAQAAQNQAFASTCGAADIRGS